MGEWMAVSAMKATMAFFFAPADRRAMCSLALCWQSLALAPVASRA